MASATAIELHGEEASPIQALGSLFRLTEVYLWEDGTTEAPQPFSINKLTHMNGDLCSEFDFATSFAVTSETTPSPEELELIEQMDALGLPISFQTNKKKQKGITKVKKKNTKIKHSFNLENENEAPESLKVSNEDAVSPVYCDNLKVCSCSMSMLGQSELSSYDVSADAHVSSYSSGEGELTSMTVIGSCSIKKMSLKLPCESTTLPNHQSIGNDYIVKNDSTVRRCIDQFPIESCVDDHAGSTMESDFNNHPLELLLPEDMAFSSSTDLLQAEESESCKQYVDYGDWMVCWDDFYQRNYFYNTKTQESTWLTPPSMEHELFAEDKDYRNGNNGILIELKEAELNPAALSSSSFQNTDVSTHDSINSLISPGESMNDFPLEFVERSSEADVATVKIDNSMVKNVDKPQGSNNGLHDEVMMLCSSDNQKPDGFGDNICGGNLGDGVIEVLDHASMINFPPELVEEDIILQSDELHTQADSHVVKRKKRSRKIRSAKKLHDVDEDVKVPLLEGYSATIEKYWYQRYLLFSRFDEGVKMDEEGWFSVTPEPIAKHHTLRCGDGIIIDGFTGVGGNAIHFAEQAKHVIAIDIDPLKIEYAQHNAIIYEVDHQIDFVNGNFFHLAPELKADTVFLSPPWGGPDYTKVKTYDMRTMLKPHDGLFLFNTSKEIAPRIVMFLPKNVDLNQLAELALSADPPWSLEVERNFLNRKLKAITAYFTKQEFSTVTDSNLSRR